MIVRNDVLVTVNSALRVRSCTNVVGYTGKYKGRKRAAVRVTGTAQVWNTNPKSGPPVAVPVSVLTTITDYGVKRVSKFYFRAVNPGAVASYSTTVTAWNVKGRSATTAAQAVNGDSAADWARTSSSWRH